MSLTADEITANNFKAFYNQIRPYLNGAAHSGFTPIGTIISVMGTTAPLNYLACDGTVYNIADYPELASYFADQFESANFFGGNGTTTFAVPDLRGEFLRGTGTNSHANQGSGANVGVHQDGTEIPFFGVDGVGQQYTSSKINADNSVLISTADYVLDADLSTRNYSSRVATSAASAPSRVTSRPTNTSVLYCIATKNIFMDAGSNYSTEEQVVGTWIDGKPIYQRVFDCGSSVTISNSTWTNTGINIPYIEHTIKGFGLYPDSAASFPLMFDCNSNNNILALSCRNDSVTVRYINLQYTKTTDS